MTAMNTGVSRHRFHIVASAHTVGPRRSHRERLSTSWRTEPSSRRSEGPEAGGMMRTRSARLPFLDLGDHSLEYVQDGPPPDNAPTLVFLHEGLGSVSLWRDFPEKLAAATGCGALVYSRRGHGRSSPAPLPRPVSFMHDEARGDLPRVLELTGVRDAVLVGHSDGASIALIHAAEHAGGASPRLRALALMAPHVFVEEESLAGARAAVEAFELGHLAKGLARHHADVENAFLGWSGIWLDPAFRSWNIEEFLPRVDVPVLAIQGEEDGYGTLRQLDAIAAGCRAPVTRVVLPRCGHAPFTAAPEETLRACVALVASVRNSPRETPSSGTSLVVP
jgi:pimeloyl-ACP methyl ester carboxylesterase